MEEAKGDEAEDEEECGGEAQREKEGSVCGRLQ